jgi:hypothetical protein
MLSSLPFDSEERCRSVNPANGNFGCQLPRGHAGPHVRRDMTWESLGTEPCYAESPDGDWFCLKDKGHSGPHQRGAATWEGG